MMTIEDMAKQAEAAERAADYAERNESNYQGVDSGYVEKSGDQEKLTRDIEHLENKVEKYDNLSRYFEREIHEGSFEEYSQYYKARIAAADARVKLAKMKMLYKSRFSSRAIIARMSSTLSDLSNRFA